MYAAKKYLLTKLVEKCHTTLLSVDTVCTLLQQSISLGEDELKEKNLKFISENMHSVVSSEAFLNLSQDALEDVVSLDTVSEISERQLFVACVKWARYQLHQLGKLHPSEEEIRDMLGNVIYHIRFPKMRLEEFADLTENSKILTADEKNDIYVYMATGRKTENFKFEVQPRRWHDNVISRFTAVREYWESEGPPEDVEGPYAVDFQTTVDICLKGVGLYGCVVPSTRDPDITVEVWKGDEILSTTAKTVTSDGSQTPVKIVLDTPVDVRANTRYTVAADIDGWRPTWYGMNNTRTFSIFDSGSITFYESQMFYRCTCIGTDGFNGQIPQLFCSKIHQH